MKMITPNCRVQFTAEDVNFILEVLARKSGDVPHLDRLLADTSTRDLLLDDESLLRALVDSSACLRTSLHLYFYILVRHALRKVGIEDREVADYVAELLAEYVREERSHFRLTAGAPPLDYFFEMMAALDKADDRGRFLIRSHMGNQSLFMTGVFPDRIRHRAETRGFPDLRYFEAIGMSSFREASHHRLAERYRLAPVFDQLGEHFQKAREALNDLADRVFCAGDGGHSLEGLMRRMMGHGGEGRILGAQG